VGDNLASKAHILSEIVRTAIANGGEVLGSGRFETETGIKVADWKGVHWARWSEAVQEAGYIPKQFTGAFEDELLFRSYAELALKLGKLPTEPELRIERRKSSKFPSQGTFYRFGAKPNWVNKLLEFCRSRSEFAAVVGLCEDYLRVSSSATDDEEGPRQNADVGYVYLLKHGSRREYKIGRTNNRLRREGEIGVELPGSVNPIHVIETDDPAGIEAYWHNRFREKRLNGEWFALTADDVRAFRRWRRIY
jgi:hypothetical protein